MKRHKQRKTRPQLASQPDDDDDDDDVGLLNVTIQRVWLQRYSAHILLTETYRNIGAAREVLGFTPRNLCKLMHSK